MDEPKLFFQHHDTKTADRELFLNLQDAMFLELENRQLSNYFSAF